MEINSKDNIQTEENVNLSTKDKNSMSEKSEKRIGYFLGDEEDNSKKIYQTGFFCNIQENSDKKNQYFF